VDARLCGGHRVLSCAMGARMTDDELRVRDVWRVGAILLRSRARLLVASARARDVSAPGGKGAWHKRGLLEPRAAWKESLIRSRRRWTRAGAMREGSSPGGWRSTNLAFTPACDSARRWRPPQSASMASWMSPLVTDGGCEQNTPLNCSIQQRTGAPEALRVRAAGGDTSITPCAQASDFLQFAGLIRRIVDGQSFKTRGEPDREGSENQSTTRSGAKALGERGADSSRLAKGAQRPSSGRF